MINDNDVDGNLIHYILIYKITVQQKLDLIKNIIDLMSIKLNLTESQKIDLINKIYDSFDSENNSLAHYATLINITEMIEYIISANRKLCNIPNKYGVLPIEFAEKYNNIECLLLLATATDPSIIKPETKLQIDKYKKLLHHIP
jgi:ankyrin repeat protein